MIHPGIHYGENQPYSSHPKILIFQNCSLSIRSIYPAFDTNDGSELSDSVSDPLQMRLWSNVPPCYKIADSTQYGTSHVSAVKSFRESFSHISLIH